MMQSQISHVHTYSTAVATLGGSYMARALGLQRPDGTWKGWLEFTPVTGVGPILTTGQETTQSDLKALEYWASGLEPVYLSGALERAQRRGSR